MAIFLVLKNYILFWKNLDAFEGDEYQRVLANVNLDNGKVQQAYVYVLNSTE